MTGPTSNAITANIGLIEQYSRTNLSSELANI